MTVVVGATISSGGLLAAGFADHVWQLCLAQGVMVGVGAGISANAAGRVAEMWWPEAIDAQFLLVGSGIGGGALALVAGRLISTGTTNSALQWLALLVFSGQLLVSLLLFVVTWSSDRLYPPSPPTAEDTVATKHQSHAVQLRLQVLRLASHGIHSVTALLPLLFMPSLIASPLAPKQQPMDGSILVAIVCVGWATGSALAPLAARQAWAFRESAVRLALSLSVWGLWLPMTADMRALACVFCSAYGILLGLVGSSASAAGALTAAAATLVGVPVAGRVVATTATTAGTASFAIHPVPALAAACSLLAAIAAAAADAVESPYKKKTKIILAGGLAEFANEASEGAYTIEWQEGSTLCEGDDAVTALLTTGSDSVSGEAAVVDAILAAGAISGEVAQWVEFARKRLAGAGFKDLEAALGELDHRLSMRAFVCGYATSAADVTAWGALRASGMFLRTLKTKRESVGAHVARWYAHIDSQPFARRLGDTLAHVHRQVNKGVRDQGSFDLGLTGVEHGKVVTRFPPEPSGYLHIGHAKAALLNEFIAKSNGGRLLIRFDDTNPEKERVEFEDSILEDLALLGIHGDMTSHTSDHFQTIYEYAVELIRRGLAYVDDTPSETMRAERFDGIESRCRQLSVAENLERFEQMRTATEFGQTCCLRAKMSIDDKNKALRDPSIYRCRPMPHHRTGSQWKIYPLYDFACPIVDSIEGVTHALRSSEYRDRNPQYTWFFTALDLRPVQIMDFSRMNFAYTLLSKRKLQWFVDQGRVPGWDDPRFPTVRGIRRRGMTIEALR
ncbi:glutamate--tRNA ligase, partial [Coemansia sp. RSA 1694]